MQTLAASWSCGTHAVFYDENGEYVEPSYQTGTECDKTIKRKSLEAAGWKFGSADEFLGERRMSDSDKVRAEFEAWARETIFIEWENGELLAEEVERLRAELAQLRKDWCDDDEAIKQQALRVLDAAKVEGDSVYVPRMGALAEMMADELVKVCAELAAAKAGLAMVDATVAENELLRVTNERLAADLAAAKADKTPPAT